MAKEAGWGVMASHRSGETEDSFIADLAVGLATRSDQDWRPLPVRVLVQYHVVDTTAEEILLKPLFLAT